MTADHCILLSSRSRGEAASDDSVEAASINMQPVTRAPRTMAGEEWSGDTGKHKQLGRRYILILASPIVNHLHSIPIK